MAYRNTPKLIYPVGNFKDVSVNFSQPSIYDKKYWGMHMGVDIKAEAETKVFSIGRGVVVYSRLHPGESILDGKIIKRNWGGIVIIAHKNPFDKKNFYSLYGHLGKRYVKRGDPVEMGELIGTVGKSLSESNGMWAEEHLHFSIYTGPYHGKVLPGYYKEDEKRTQLNYWKDPFIFVENYNPRGRLG